MKSGLTVLLTALLTVTLLLVSPAAAQSTFGSITGTVRDQTGARVANARITVTNQDTGVSRKITTGADGVYAVTDLPAGRYRIEVEASGFSMLQRNDGVLDANRVVNVDAQLAVGSPSTKLEVSAVEPVINTETSATSFVKPGAEIADTPLLMRQSHGVLGFAVYNPGANIGSSVLVSTIVRGLRINAGRRDESRRGDASVSATTAVDYFTTAAALFPRYSPRTSSRCRPSCNRPSE